MPARPCSAEKKPPPRGQSVELAGFATITAGSFVMDPSFALNIPVVANRAAPPGALPHLPFSLGPAASCAVFEPAPAAPRQARASW